MSGLPREKKEESGSGEPIYRPGLLKTLIVNVITPISRKSWEGGRQSKYWRYALGRLEDGLVEFSPLNPPQNEVSVSYINSI